MQIVWREQRKISLISVIAKKSGRQGKSGFNHRRGGGSLKETVTQISTEWRALTFHDFETLLRHRDFFETMGGGVHSEFSV